VGRLLEKKESEVKGEKQGNIRPPTVQMGTLRITPPK